MISVKNLKFTYLNSKKLSLKIDSLQVAKGGMFGALWKKR